MDRPLPLRSLARFAGNGRVTGADRPPRLARQRTVPHSYFHATSPAHFPFRPFLAIVLFVTDPVTAVHLFSVNIFGSRASLYTPFSSYHETSLELVPFPLFLISSSWTESSIYPKGGPLLKKLFGPSSTTIWKVPHYEPVDTAVLFFAACISRDLFYL